MRTIALIGTLLALLAGCGKDGGPGAQGEPGPAGKDSWFRISTSVLCKGTHPTLDLRFEYRISWDGFGDTQVTCIVKTPAQQVSTTQIWDQRASVANFGQCYVALDGDATPSYGFWAFDYTGRDGTGRVLYSDDPSSPVDRSYITLSCHSY